MQIDIREKTVYLLFGLQNFMKYKTDFDAVSALYKNKCLSALLVLKYWTPRRFGLFWLAFWPRMA